MNFTDHRDFMDYVLKDDLVIDVSTCVADGGNENEGVSYGFDDVTTPVKECRELVYSGENKNKDGLPREPMLQLKRRRILQFESEVLDSPFCNEEISQTFFGSQLWRQLTVDDLAPFRPIYAEQKLQLYFIQETGDTLDMDITELSQWVSSFTESTSASCSEVLDLSSEEWVAECFSDPDLYMSFEETGNKNTLGTPDGQVITELDKTPFSEAKTVPDQPLCTRQNIVFKGKKSYMQAPKELPSSVAYPFDFIKPCGIHGDVTLKDINQKILTPKPKSKPRDEDHSDPYPISALTGKPVVGKTKLRTEGGTGSITIMRTRG